MLWKWKPRLVVAWPVADRASASRKVVLLLLLFSSLPACDGNSASPPPSMSTTSELEANGVPVNPTGPEVDKPNSGAASLEAAGGGQSRTEEPPPVEPTTRPAPTSSAPEPAARLVEPTTQQALQVEDLELGHGKKPQRGEPIRVHLILRTESGTEILSTRGGPPLQGRYGELEWIAGLEEGIENMKRGGKRRLVIPPRWAYGQRGIPRAPGNGWLIPPGATLVAELELLDEPATPPRPSGTNDPKNP